MTFPRIFILLLAMLLSACGGVDVRSARNSASTEARDWIETTQGQGQYVRADSVYEQLPDVRKGKEGELKQSERQKVLDMVNTIRRLHKLAPVEYHYDSDIDTARASLVLSVRGELDHFPKKRWKHWSQEAYNGASTSNLGMQWSSAMRGAVPNSSSYIYQWMIDHSVESLGHRHWIMYPGLKYISFGRADGGKASVAALKVVFGKKQSAPESTRFIAFPQGDYPASFIRRDWYLSFSALKAPEGFVPTPGKKYNKEFDYRKAKVRVINARGRALRTYSEKPEGAPYTGPDYLKWKVKGLELNQEYKVTIKNVLVMGTKTTYEYTFRLVP